MSKAKVIISAGCFSLAIICGLFDLATCLAGLVASCFVTVALTKVQLS